jgi:SAM-dependent methyltransferase
MSTTLDIDPVKLEEFQGRVFADLAAGYGGVMTSLGAKLGLYKALAGAGPLTSADVAGRAGCAERYVREWLNSQAAAGYVDYDRDRKTYELPAERAAVLADPDSPAHLTPAFEVVASMWLDEHLTIEAFRTGKGVPWGAHDERLSHGVAAFFRTGYRTMLVPEWLLAMDGVVTRLQTGATVADIGCGHGHSTVLMAEAFPNSRYHGYDTHVGSIAAARDNAAAAGFADRVTFTVGTAHDYAERGFDLICFFDCLHDMGDPLGAVQHARGALAPGGSVLLVEPAAADDIADNVGPIAQVYYSASTTLCCAHALSEGGETLGAQAGEARLAGLFSEAGFDNWNVVAKTPFNLIAQVRTDGPDT